MTKPNDNKALSLKFRQNAAVITFERPEIKNPLSIAVLSLLEEKLINLNNSAECTRIVFTGTGNTFAAGANLRQVAALNPETALEFGRFGQRVFGLIRNSPKLTIAAVNGFCMGGALDLALSCDSRIASSEAVFAHPGVKLGIITGWGGTQMLPALIGRKNAYQMLLTADRIGADEALRIGLIDEIAANPLEQAFAREGEQK